MRNIFQEHPLDMCTKLLDTETSLCKNSIQTSSPYIYASVNISTGSSPCIIKEEAASPAAECFLAHGRKQDLLTSTDLQSLPEGLQRGARLHYEGIYSLFMVL